MLVPSVLISVPPGWLYQQLVPATAEVLGNLTSQTFWPAALYFITMGQVIDLNVEFGQISLHTLVLFEYLVNNFTSCINISCIVRGN